MSEEARERGQWLGITLSLWMVIALAVATGATLIFFHLEHVSLSEQIKDLRGRVERLENAPPRP